MPLIPATSAAPSRRPYALDLTTLRQDPHGRWHVEAIWLGRKQSQTRVSYGQFSFWWQGPGPDCRSPELTFDDLAAHCDERYGGEPWYVCDENGNLWVNPSSRAPSPKLEQQLAIAKNLIEALHVLPAVPENYDGWYHLVPRQKAEVQG